MRRPQKSSFHRQHAAYQRRDILRYLAVMVLFIFLMAKGFSSLGYHWQWYRVWPYIGTFEEGRFQSGLLIQGLYVTLKMTALSMVISFFVGLIAAILRLSPSFLGRVLSRTYLEAIRNTPLLVQLFFVYFVIAPVFDISRFASAVIALSLFEGAYASEIFRAGILSIEKGQWEAAKSLGLANGQIYRKIILPQAIKRMLPPLTNQAISLIKDSALVSTIAIYDITMHAQSIISETYLVFEIWFTVALIYFLLTLMLSFWVRRMENRLNL